MLINYKKISIISIVTATFLLTSCGGGSSGLPDTIPEDKQAPLIIKTMPGSSDQLVVDVSVADPIIVTFNEDILTPNTSNIVLYRLGNNDSRINPPIQGEVGYDNLNTKTAKFATINFLDKATRYEVLVKNIKDNNNNQLLSSYSWKFETTKNPTIVKTTPADKAATAAPRPTISINFSEAILEKSLFNNGVANITVTNVSNAANNYDVAIKSIKLKSNDTKTVQFDLTEIVISQNTYKITILGGSSGITDLAGNAFIGNNNQNYTWLFNTTDIDSVKPKVLLLFPKDQSLATANTPFTIRFNEDMNQNSLLGSFSVYDETEYNAGILNDLIPNNYSFNYDANLFTASYTSNGLPLSSPAKYKMVLRLTATDQSGNTLEPLIAGATEIVSTFSVSTANWTTPRALVKPKTGSVQLTNLIADPNGGISAVIGIRDVPANSYALTHQLLDNTSNTWQTDGLAAKTTLAQTSSVIGPYTASNSNGDIFSLWRWTQQNTEKAYLSYYGDSKSGKQWSAPKTINIKPLLRVRNVPTLAIAASDNGDAMAVWIETTATTGINTIKFSKFTKDPIAFGGSWSAAADVMTANPATMVKVALDAQGNGFLVWAENSEVKIIHQSNGVWDNTTIRSLTTKHNGWELELQMDNAANALVAWDELGTPTTTNTRVVNLHASYYNKTLNSWDNLPTIIGSSGQYNNSKLNVSMNRKNGFAILSYILRYPVGDPNGDTVYATYFDKKAWSTPTIIGNSTIWVESNVDIFDDGRAIVVMTQNNVDASIETPYITYRGYNPAITGNWSSITPIYTNSARTTGVHIKYNSNGQPTVIWRTSGTVADLYSSSLK